MLSSLLNTDRMLGYSDTTMTITPPSGKTKLSEEEWNELVALKDAINQYPQAVCPSRMERFTEYLVRSMKEKGG